MNWLRDLFFEELSEKLHEEWLDELTIVSK